MRIIYLLSLLLFSYSKALLGENTPNTDLPPLSLSSTITPDTCGQGKGAVNLSVSNGVAPYTYSWSNGETTEDLSNVPAGDYTVTVTDAIGETATHTATVNDISISINANLSRINDHICVGDPDGVAISNPLPPNPGYTFLWSTGATTNSINTLSYNTYTVTVTLGTCSVVSHIVVKTTPLYPMVTSTTINTNCDLPNGSIDLSYTPAQYTPYTYLWSNGETTQDLMDVLPGLYIVTVTGQNGCEMPFYITVFNHNPPINLSGTTVSNTSCVPFNGSINLNATPNGTYTYEWSTGETTQDLANIPPGSYAVTVSNGGTCTNSATFEIDENINPIEIFISSTDATCGQSNGIILPGVTGGIAPYTFDWAHIPGVNNPPNLYGVAAGNYFLTVTSANGCTAESNTFITNEVSFDVSGILTQNTSCTAPDGSINVSISPPNGGNYSYIWSNGATTQDLSGLQAGAYSLIVRKDSCTTTIVFNVATTALSPNLSIVATTADCGQNNGALLLNVTGAMAPYSFLWSNTATTEDLANVPAGIYSVTVTDSLGCKAIALDTVLDNTIALHLALVSTANTSCSNFNGSLDMSVLPLGAYTFTWSNGVTTEDLSNVPPGIYSVTITDSLGCKTFALDTVLENTIALNLALVSTANTSCSNFNGSLDMSVLPLGAYTFNWSNGVTTEDLSNAPPGIYSVTITDSLGCKTFALDTVPDNTIALNLAVAPTSNTSCINFNGSVDLSILPVGNYAFSWSNGATTEDLTNVIQGNYSVTASDANGCTATVFATVLDNTSSPQLAAAVLDAICGQNNGNIDISTTGSASPFNYVWSNAVTTEDLANILPGNYSLTVTDANGCSADTALNVANNASTFSLSGASSPHNNCTTQNGSIDLSVTPAGAYTYLWSGGETTEDLTGLTSGTYTVQVTESGNCVASATYFVANALSYPSLQQNTVAELCNLSDGSIDLSVLGGLAPFNFLWASGQTTEDLSNIGGGNHTVTVTDANNCTDVVTVNVPENTLSFSLAGTVSPNSACSVLNNGSIDLSITPALPSGGPGYNYSWSNGSGSQDLTGIPAGNYLVTVSAGGNCTSTASFTVGNTAPLTAGGTAADILCFGENTGAIDLNLNGGTQPFNFNWSPNLGNVEDPVGLAAGNYTVTITDSGGCSVTANFNLSQPVAAVQAACTVLNTVSQPGLLDGNASVQIGGGVAPYTILWSPGGLQTGIAPGVFPLNNLGVGNYAVTLTDANGCSSICGFTIGLASCFTAVGTMGTAQLSHCNTGCITANYDALGQFLGPNDVLQFVLHEGSGGLIVNELARSSQPTFCFNPAKMSYGSTYYVSAVVGDNVGSGNVDLAHFCAVISTGTPIVFYEKPVAGTALPNPITCASLQVSILGSSSLPNSTFQWSTSNGNILGNAAQANIESDKAGDYTLVINSNGCLDTTATTVTDIRNDPAAKISASPDDILDCVIDEIVLTGEVKGSSNANTVWVDGNGTIYPNGTVLTIELPGTYQFVILDTITFCADTASIIINQNQLYPPLFVNPPATLTCSIGSVTLSGGSPLSGILFEWATVNGQDTVVIGTGPNVNVTQPNDYLLIGSDPVNGCNNALIVTVTADQSFPAASAGPPLSIDCSGQTITLNGSATGGSGILSYQWTSSDGVILSGSNTLAPTVGEPGTYTLLVTSTDNGCSDMDIVVVSPREPVAIAIVGQPGCFGQMGTILIDTVLGAKQPIKYTLTGGPHIQSGNFFSALETGDYTIFVEDASGCTTSVGATITEPPVFEVMVEPQVTIQLGDSYQVDAIVNVPQSEIAQITWTPPSWLSCDSCLSTRIEAPLSTQEYQILVITKAGCRDEAPLLLRVDNDVKVYIPNIFSPNGDGENDGFTVFADTRGVKQVKLFQIFSRWGEEVFVRENFQPNDPALGWDGRFRGQDMNPAVFVYYAVVEFIDGQEVLYKGDVTVER